MTNFRKIILGSASAALLASSITPAFAAPMYHGQSHGLAYAQNNDGIFETNNQYRGRGGWGHRDWGHRDRGVDAGDVLAGIGILAGIAIIASAASDSNKRSRSRDSQPDSYPQDSRYPASDRNSSSADYNGGNDLSTAVNTCSNAAEQRAGGNAQVEEIRSVKREGAGWRVDGNLSGEQAPSFSCGTNNGQVEFIQLNT
jgi:hypothetical protein